MLKPRIEVDMTQTLPSFKIKKSYFTIYTFRKPTQKNIDYAKKNLKSVLHFIYKPDCITDLKSSDIWLDGYLKGLGIYTNLEYFSIWTVPKGYDLKEVEKEIINEFIKNNHHEIMGYTALGRINVGLPISLIKK